eukprot:TRINITY_DN64533_c0_g1_i2.p1 TRINITY_DN64533_c0_g1~~TRINITY_DN64533_c0_g1_i2.p1  ORF type:complete len:702 (-),score=53.32 TRINITY_DN64533_c0_g1_i2:146-2251(-)
MAGRSDVGKVPVASSRLKLSVKFSYALPRFTIRAAYVIIQVYGQLYYMQLGAKLRFMAFYNAVGRALDVITDPAMGWITDSTRTSCGRRKPYLLTGFFVYTAVLGALFHPPETGDADFVTHWYGCCYCLFFVVDTFANVPYYALGMELTSDYDQRNSLYFWQHVLGQGGTMIGAVLPAVLSDFLKMDLRNAYAITGWSFGSFYSLGIGMILLLVKERPVARSPKDGGPSSPPLVREMLRIYRNEGFVPWMMAYILDYAAIGILATMVPLFSQYVLVEPDSTDCKQQCYDWNPAAIDCTCAKLATEWLGWIMAATFLSAMVSVPLWSWVARRFKKHTAWLIYSWWNVLTAPFRIFCGKGSLGLTAALSAMNGSAFGGQFIGESVMADLSDYDEFLYGDRAEGMLGVIATLGPKMVLVVCFVVPLAAIATLGFQDSVWPEETLANANFFKSRFPLKRKEQLDQILEGIEKHKLGLEAEDPISGKMVTILVPSSDEERQQVWALEMWGATIGGKSACIRRVLAAHALSSESGGKHVSRKSWGVLRQRAWTLLLVWVTCFAAALAATAGTFQMLEKESTSWIPTSLCIFCGSALVFTCISVLRLRAAIQLSKCEVSVAMVEALLERAKDGGHRSADKTFADSNVSSKVVPDPGSPVVVSKEVCDLRRAAQDAALDCTGQEGLPSRPSAREFCPWRGARPKYIDLD